MIVLKIVGYIAGGLAAALLIVFVPAFLLLLPRVGMDVHAQDGTFTAKIRYGWIDKTIRLPKGRKKQQKEGKKSEKPSKPSKKKSPREGMGKDILSKLDLGDVMCEVLDFLDDVKDRLRIDVLYVHAVLATGDAAKTGLSLGYLSAVTGIIYPFLARNFTIKTLEIVLDGDFEGGKARYDLRFACSFRPIRMLAAGVKHGFRLYRMIRQTQKVEAKAK